MTENTTDAPDQESKIDFSTSASSTYALLIAEDLAPTLSHFARLQEERAVQLTNAAERLEKQSPAETSRASSIAEAARTAEELKFALRMTAAREARLSRRSNATWIASGRVVDAEGGPVSCARVEVYDKDARHDDLVGTNRTDEYGYFEVVYEDSDFRDLIESRPDLYVIVKDEHGKKCETGPSEVRYEANRIEFFYIVLKEKPSTPPWVVHGRVVDAEGRPVSGVLVKVYDKDVVGDDLVGNPWTDEYGYFEAVYSQGDFSRLLGLERKPDLYVRVEDEHGNELYETSRGEVRYEAGRTEHFDIKLDTKRPGSHSKDWPTPPPLEQLAEQHKEQDTAIQNEVWHRRISRYFRS